MLTRTRMITCLEVAESAAERLTRSCTCYAEDLRQEVLERVLRKPHRFGAVAEEKLPGYVWSTARRAHLDAHRSRWARRTSLDSLEGCLAGPLIAGPEQEAVAGLKRALARLSAADREALASVALDRRPAEEAAASLGLQVDALYQRSSRAERRLRGLLGLTARRGRCNPGKARSGGEAPLRRDRRTIRG